MIGNSTPRPADFRRETAKYFGSDESCLDNRVVCANMKHVVVAPSLRAGTLCSNRYPSPYGRRESVSTRSPVFLPLNSIGCVGGRHEPQQIAMHGFASQNDNSVLLYMKIRIRAVLRGIPKCTSSYGFRLSQFAERLVLVATQRWSRGLWGRGPVLPVLLSSTKTQQLARPLVRQQTFSIVSRPNAADPRYDQGVKGRRACPNTGRRSPNAYWGVAQKYKGTEHDNDENYWRIAGIGSTGGLFSLARVVQPLQLQPIVFAHVGVLTNSVTRSTDNRNAYASPALVRAALLHVQTQTRKGTSHVQ